MARHRFLERACESQSAENLASLLDVVTKVPCGPTPEERRSILRERAVNILSLISSEEEQLDYERNVPIANIPGELQCQWFDDFYRHHELPSFQDSFSLSERDLLTGFDAFFDVKEPSLPRDPDSIQIWLDDPTWREIMAKAEETLQRWRELNPGE